ncbi:MAG: hypothetical protein NC247_14910, partial [Ruminococcus flavefaciens]|nr:hypothetical protein [Ruminococcus flavefaciens]
RLRRKIFLDISGRIIILKEKEQPPTRWVDRFRLVEKSTPRPVKVLGWFFYVALLTERENECKQCQKEQTEGHYILKIKMIFHRRHLHSIGISGQPTLQHGALNSIIA